MLSPETLRYKQIQSDIVYRREVGALGSARRNEEHANKTCRVQEQIFWKEVSRISSVPAVNTTGGRGVPAAPLDRVLAAHTKLLEAKRAHASALGELQAGVVRVSQSDALRTKIRELQQVLKQRSAALSEVKKEDEITEMLTQMPSVRRNKLPQPLQRSVETESCKSAVRAVDSDTLNGERRLPDSAVVTRLALPTDPDRAVGTWTNPPAAVSAVSVAKETPTVQSVELRPLGDGPCLRVQSVLSNGTPVTISLTRSGPGGVSAVVESPNLGITAQLQRERAHVLAKLGSLGVSLSGLEVRRGGYSSVGAERSLRRPRWIEEDEDENNIA